MSQTLDDNLINVAVRVRPFLPKDNQSNALQIVDSSPPSLVVKEKELQYFCDHVFSEKTDQQTVFDEMVKPNIEHVFKGQCCTVFAYGQTGTGKTFTMGTNPNDYIGEESGILPKTLEKIFTHKLEDNLEAQISISFLEIYNEKAYDLLTNNKECLQMKGFILQNLKKVPVEDAAEALRWLTIGSQNRHIGETKLNSKSSRSHAIFTLYLNLKDENSEIDSKLHLVDLAGSENVKRLGNEGVQFKESININKGLFYVGQVINALANNGVPPYRESTLTRILHDSLTYVNHVTLIACISPSVSDVTETIATLDFARKIKKIKNAFKTIPSHTKITNSGTIKRTYGFTNPNNTAPKAKKTLFSDTPQQAYLSSIPMHSSRYLPRVPEKNSPRSLFNMSLSSISTITDYAPNLSPIVKRCAEALEETMMSKLETIVKSQLRTVHSDQQNTPVFWKKLELKVSKLIRSEMSQFKLFQEPMACSSPKNEEKVEDKSALETHGLNFGNITPRSPKIPDANVEAVPEISRIEPSFDFKVPITKKNRKNDESVYRKCPRRSVRLSTCRKSGGFSVSNVSYSTRRGSRRFAMLDAEKKAKTPKRTVVQPKTGRTAQKQHEEGILRTLNEGNEKELMNLITVGKKTALQIVNYRKLVAKFGSVKELQNMPGWTGYKKFVNSNYLNFK